MIQKNTILICGRLGKNPELKYTKNQEAVCVFTVAENIDQQDKPNWHRVIVWGRQAESCSVHLKKGSSVFVQGRNFEKEFTNNEGIKKKYIELKAESIGISLD